MPPRWRWRGHGYDLTMPKLRTATTLLITGVLAGATACTSPSAQPPAPSAQPEATSSFTPAGAAGITCMDHQGRSPGTQDTDPSVTMFMTLPVIRYYKDNGSKPYCDGQGPTAIDRQWAQYAVDNGGAADSVKPILSPATPANGPSPSP